MKIWLVNTGEEISFEKKGNRRMRMGQLCFYLRNAGHEVVYWTSCFTHSQKILRAKKTFIYKAKNLTVIYLRAPGYRQHISLARLWDHFVVAREFLRVAPKNDFPDLIVCSYPTIELAHVVTKFGKRHGIPVILDVRDMWPDLIIMSVPRCFQPFVRLAIKPYELLGSSALHRATVLTSITEKFLNWSTVKAQRGRLPLDRVLHFCNEETTYCQSEVDAAKRFWASHGVADNSRPIVLFLGTLGHSIDLFPVIRSAEILANQKANGPLFVLCGDGNMAQKYRERARGLENIIMPGWINAVQIRTIMELASVAISPLPDRLDFKITINNKFTEYLSGGLPILVSPPDCETARLVTEAGCGCGFLLKEPVLLASILKELLSKPKELAIWKQRARRLFNSRFRADHILSQWMHLIDEVVKSCSSKNKSIPYNLQLTTVKKRLTSKNGKNK